MQSNRIWIAAYAGILAIAAYLGAYLGSPEPAPANETPSVVVEVTPWLDMEVSKQPAQPVREFEILPTPVPEPVQPLRPPKVEQGELTRHDWTPDMQPPDMPPPLPATWRDATRDAVLEYRQHEGVWQVRAIRMVPQV